MKAIIYTLISLSFFSNSFASELKQFCDKDPTGELYSEIFDSSAEDGFEIIGLKLEKYSKVIKRFHDKDLFEIADKTRISNPEIKNALEIWKLNTCITRGYEMLHEQ